MSSICSLAWQIAELTYIVCVFSLRSVKRVPRAFRFYHLVRCWCLDPVLFLLYIAPELISIFVFVDLVYCVHVLELPCWAHGIVLHLRLIPYARGDNGSEAP